MRIMELDRVPTGSWEQSDCWSAQVRLESRSHRSDIIKALTQVLPHPSHIEVIRGKMAHT